MSQQLTDPAVAESAGQPDAEAQPDADATAVAQSDETQGGDAFDFSQVTDQEIRDALASGNPEDAVAFLSRLKGDYTTKTQTLSEQRRELETNANLTGWTQDLVTALNDDPDQAAAMLESALTSLRGPQSQQQAPVAGAGDTIQTPIGNFSQSDLTEMWDNADPTVKLLAHSLRQQQELIDSMKQQHAATADTLVSREITGKLADLHKQYGDFDEDPVLAKAQALAKTEGITDPLGDAYRIVHWDSAVQRGETTAVERMRQKREASPPTASGAGGTPQRKRATSALEAIEMARQGQ